MEKIEKYVKKFFATTQKNIRFGMKFCECNDFVQEIRKGDNPFSVASMLFDYGYAKGYRACLTEMKKGGAS